MLTPVDNRLSPFKCKEFETSQVHGRQKENCSTVDTRLFHEFPFSPLSSRCITITCCIRKQAYPFPKLPFPRPPPPAESGQLHLTRSHVGVWAERRSAGRRSPARVPCHVVSGVDPDGTKRHQLDIDWLGSVVMLSVNSCTMQLEPLIKDLDWSCQPTGKRQKRRKQCGRFMVVRCEDSIQPIGGQGIAE